MAPLVPYRRHQKRRHVHARSPNTAEAELTQAALQRQGRQEATLHGGRQRPTTAIITVLRSRCMHRHRFYARHWNEQRKCCHRRRRGSRQRRAEDAVALVDDALMEVLLDHDLACHITRNIKHLLKADRTGCVASVSLNWNWTFGQFDLSIDLINTSCGGDRKGA